MKKNIITILLAFLLLFIIQCKKTANIKDGNQSQDGLAMSDEKFDEQLKRILNERKLKPKKKITKDILKEIFTEIYKYDFTVNANLHVDENPNMNAQEEANKFMNDIFSILTRGIDSDQKIRVKEIKDYISPKRAQNAMNDVINNLEEMMGNL